MSSSIRAIKDDIAECESFLHTHGMYMRDLNLQERYEARRGNLTKLKQLLEDRGVLLCPGLQQKESARPAIAEEWAQEYFQDPEPLEETQGIPADAVLYQDDGEYAFYWSPSGGIYVTESQSDEELSNEDRGDSVTKEDIIRAIEEIAETHGDNAVIVAAGPLARAFSAIVSEREYQEKLWGEGSASGGGYTAKTEDENNERSLDEWTLYILRYANRLAMTNCRDDAVYLEKLDTIRKIAALCVAAMEQLGAHPRSEDEISFATTDSRSP